jgi:putative spermidine/putrescine transport system permease protein
MFSGIHEQIGQTILAVATILICISIFLLASIELLCHRNKRLRGIRPNQRKHHSAE